MYVNKKSAYISQSITYKDVQLSLIFGENTMSKQLLDSQWFFLIQNTVLNICCDYTTNKNRRILFIHKKII